MERRLHKNDINYVSHSDDSISLKGLSVLKNLSDFLRPFSPSTLLCYINIVHVHKHSLWVHKPSLCT